MRARNLIGLTLALTSLALVANGCSSAPTEEKAKTGEQEWVFRPPPPIPPPSYCAMLPALKELAPAKPYDYNPQLDCYHHVTGYEIAVDPGTNECPYLSTASGGVWYPTSWTPGPTSGLAVPAWTTDADSANTCQYSFASYYDANSQVAVSMPPGLDKTTEQSTALELCDALGDAHVGYHGVRYILPPLITFAPGYGGVSVGPNGVPIADFDGLFSSYQVCPTIYGGCDSCLKQ